jgi:hypothetical protein
LFINRDIPSVIFVKKSASAFCSFLALEEKMQKILPNLCVHIPPPAKCTFIINVSSSICPLPGRQPGTDCQRVIKKLESKNPDIIWEVMVIPDRIKQTDQIRSRNIHSFQIKKLVYGTQFCDFPESLVTN